MRRDTHELNQLLNNCQRSLDILEYLPRDEDRLRERLSFVAELQTLVRHNGAEPEVRRGSLWKRVAGFFRSHKSAQALIDERARDDQRLLRSYEGVCEHDFPLDTTMVLLRQHDAIKRKLLKDHR